MPVMYFDNTALLSGIVAFAAGSLTTWPRSRRNRAQLAQVKWAASHDSLTGLPNRASAQRQFREFAEAEQPCVVVLVDLDDFKAVNDTWGHRAGDQLLKSVSDRLAAACGPRGFAARLGGDEFLLLMPWSAATETARVLESVSAMLDMLRAPTALAFDDAATVVVEAKASAGIALPALCRSWAEQLNCADIALYEAKRVRGSTVIFEQSMYQRSRVQYRHGQDRRTVR